MSIQLPNTPAVKEAVAAIQYLASLPKKQRRAILDSLCTMPVAVPANVVPYPYFPVGVDYADATGKHLEALKNIPGPKERIFLNTISPN